MSKRIFAFEYRGGIVLCYWSTYRLFHIGPTTGGWNIAIFGLTLAYQYKETVDHIKSLFSKIFKETK